MLLNLTSVLFLCIAAKQKHNMHADVKPQLQIFYGKTLRHMPTTPVLHPKLNRSCIKTPYKKERLLFDEEKNLSTQKKNKEV